MVRLSAKLEAIKSEYSAVSVIMSGNFVFLSSAVFNRDKFVILEFYLFVCFIQFVVAVVCFQLLRQGQLHLISEDFRNIKNQQKGSTESEPDKKLQNH